MNATSFCCGFAAAVVIIGSPAAAMAASHGDLEEALTGKYTLTKTGIDRMRITQPGTVLVIQQDGIIADLGSDATYTDNRIIEGKIEQAHGMAGFLQEKSRSRTLKSGEKVYLYKIEVKDDKVRYYLITCDTFDVDIHGSSRQTRYKALLSFELGKDQMETATADAIKKTADTVVIPEADAKAANTKTVNLGQTPEEVQAILGNPDRIINLGAKQIYVYKDMKIIFQDGKVSDVQ